MARTFEVRKWEDGRLMFRFWCEGCNTSHAVPVDMGGWRLRDGSAPGRPTLTPSLLSTYGDERICHLFVTDGRVQYLTDSTHHLSGQTIDLPNLPDEE